MEKDLFEFFEQRISACANEQKRLQEEGYGDEANFEKIKANVYDIFRRVLSAGMKQYGNDRPGIYGFLRERLEQIPSGWSAAYEKAREHDDVENMHIESIKLGIVQDIKENIFQAGREEK